MNKWTIGALAALLTIGAVSCTPENDAKPSKAKAAEARVLYTSNGRGEFEPCG